VTKTQLYAYVRGYLDQDSTTLSDDTLDVLTQAVEGHLNRSLRDHHRMRQRIAWPSKDDTIPLPETLVQLKQVSVGDTVYQQYPTQQEQEASQNSPSFVSYGNCIKVFPAPTEATTYLLDVILALPSLTDALSDPNWVAEYHADIYQRGLLAEAAGFLRDPQNQATWRQSFETLVEELRLQGWNEGIADAPRVRAV
jgi:hypothetical protein